MLFHLIHNEATPWYSVPFCNFLSVYNLSLVTFVQREAYKKRCVVAMGRIGDRAMGFKRYNIAALHFKIVSIVPSEVDHIDPWPFLVKLCDCEMQASHHDPTNHTWTSKQSLCNAHANRRTLALYDVERFLRFKLRMPGPHPGDADAAAWISKVRIRITIIIHPCLQTNSSSNQ